MPPDEWPYSAFDTSHQCARAVAGQDLNVLVWPVISRSLSFFSVSLSFPYFSLPPSPHIFPSLVYLLPFSPSAALFDERLIGDN